MSETELSMDYEGGSNAVLTGPSSVGLHNYVKHPSTKPFMLAYAWNRGTIEHIDFTKGQTLPPEVKDALLDPKVIKRAFNSQFERVYTREVLGIPTPVEGWRCTMVHAYMRSFSGGLENVGVQIGLAKEKLKSAAGTKLINMFCKPQRISKNQPLLWRDRHTNPDEWEEFCRYNVQDVASEIEIANYLDRYPVPEDEWRLYEIDQEINDRGMPVNMQFVYNAMDMVRRRKSELFDMMQEITGLKNPNSGPQLLPWLQDRGYGYSDLQKNTVKKALGENEDGTIIPECVAVLKLRQQASRTSVKKYDAIARRISSDRYLRYCFQFAGAGRTNRWAGRGPQPQNLVRTPKLLEGIDGDFSRLEAATLAITLGDYDLLEVITGEVMTALAGCIRSSFQAPNGYEFVVCDLSAIESAVIAWLSRCIRMLKVFEDGRDPYKDFGTALYKKPYALITKEERGICKPPTLGCGFGLGGGLIRDGKRTGLWGYAEGMGVNITKEEAAKQVAVFREIYPEVPQFWKKLEDASHAAVGGKSSNVNGLLHLAKRGEYMTMRLPSGRLMYYHKPRVETKEFMGKNGKPYTKRVFTCMGKSQVSGKWTRIMSGGPKLCENAVQATAREILAAGMRRAYDFGFKIVGSVHDELICLRRKGDNYFTLQDLHDCMVKGIWFTEGLPLKAAGYVNRLYVKE